MKLLSEGGLCLTKSWITSVNSSWVEGKSWVGLRSRPATRRAFTGTHSLIHLSSRPYEPTNHAVVSSIFRSAGIPFTLCVYSQDSVTRALEAKVILGIRNPRAVFVPVAGVVRRATACCYNRNSKVLKDGVPRYRNHRAVAQLFWCLKAGLWSSVMELIGSTDSYSAINLHDGDNRGGPLAILDWFNGPCPFKSRSCSIFCLRAYCTGLALWKIGVALGSTWILAVAPCRVPSPSNCWACFCKISSSRLLCDESCLIMGQFSLILSSQFLPSKAGPLQPTTKTCREHSTPS